MSIDRETARRRLRAYWRKILGVGNDGESVYVDTHCDDIMRDDSYLADCDPLTPEFVRAHALALAEVQRMALP